MLTRHSFSVSSAPPGLPIAGNSGDRHAGHPWQPAPPAASAGEAGGLVKGTLVGAAAGMVRTLRRETEAFQVVLTCNTWGDWDVQAGDVCTLSEALC